MPPQDNDVTLSQIVTPKETSQPKQQSSQVHKDTLVLVLGSSNTKYINSDMLFGPKPAKCIRVSTAQQAIGTMENLDISNSMEIVICHFGLNDLRQDRSPSDVKADIETCLRKAATKYPHAAIGYSELLQVSHNHKLMSGSLSSTTPSTHSVHSSKSLDSLVIPNYRRWMTCMKILCT